MTRRSLWTNSWRYIQGTAHSLTPQELLFNLPTSYLCLDRGKTSSHSLLDVWEEWKQSKAAKILFYCIHHEIAKGQSRNPPKAYEVNGRRVHTKFVSLAVLAKPLYLEDYSKRASLTRIRKLTFIVFDENSSEFIAAEIEECSSFDWTRCVLYRCCVDIYVLVDLQEFILVINLCKFNL
jgi:hypothetical protein